MMKVGIDIVEISRFLNKMNDSAFVTRIFTKREREHIAELNSVEGVAERMAGKFAAKEAVAKMLGTGLDKGIKWTDIEILPDPLGKPTLNLIGFASEYFDALKLKEVDISISHSGTQAIAICVAI